MSVVNESAAMVGFYGDDLDPREITALLGSEPTVGVAKGHTWTTRAGREKTAFTGSWRLNADRSQPGDLEGQINALLDRLTDDLSVWRSLSERFRGVVFCGVFLKEGNEGLVLLPGTLLRVGERGLYVDLDIYGGSTSD